MTITSLEMLIISFSFIVPGFIIDSVYRKCLPQAPHTNQNALIRYLLFSFINNLLFLWVIANYLSAPGSWDVINYISGPESTILTYFLLSIVIIIGPAIIGFAVGVLSNTAWFQKWIKESFQMAGVHPIHTIPTAWDYKFSKVTEPKYVMINLTGDRVIGGYYGEKSVASSTSNERDIFLEEAYEIDIKSGEWTKKNTSILIKSNFIEAIEFVEGGQEDNDEGK
ncbi:DUF6338 family protein [Jeotgalibacillus marinus]|uniref:DUF6338 family protein n=1 Tax=Jeotgalibacillus marinus TaxID=86667 RepID=A0ABV3Q7L1_9BACL